MSIFDPKNDDEERMRNFMLYRMYMTNKERDEAAPVLTIIFFILIAIVVVLFLCGFTRHP